VSDWRHRARCRGVDPELFFPDSTDQTRIIEAKAVCTRCPVRLPCREWALQTGVAGIWGGLDEVERRAIRGERARRKATA
jgi:WhiB family transcriptional regulator, redox-sensing transcriptional regulator